MIDIAPSPRRAAWLAFAIAAALLFIPDCCLTGGHAHGAAMATYGRICFALR